MTQRASNLPNESETREYFDSYGYNVLAYEERPSRGLIFVVEVLVESRANNLHSIFTYDVLSGGGAWIRTACDSWPNRPDSGISNRI